MSFHGLLIDTCNLSIATTYTQGEFGALVTKENWTAALTSVPCRINIPGGDKEKLPDIVASKYTHKVYMEQDSTVDVTDRNKMRITLASGAYSGQVFEVLLSAPVWAHHWKFFTQHMASGNP